MQQEPQKPVLPAEDAGARQEPRADDDQSWFWTAEWQAEEAEATQDIQRGRLTRLHTPEEITEHFESLQDE